MSKEEKDPLEYDDEAAIAFIRNQIPQEMKDKYKDDDYYLLLDTIYDFYEKKGYLKDDDEVVDIDVDELTTFVYKELKKGMAISQEEVGFMVDAEIAYCDSLGVFQD